MTEAVPPHRTWVGKSGLENLGVYEEGLYAVAETDQEAVELHSEPLSLLHHAHNRKLVVVAVQLEVVPDTVFEQLWHPDTAAEGPPAAGLLPSAHTLGPLPAGIAVEMAVSVRTAVVAVPPPFVAPLTGRIVVGHLSTG